jgi:hypothetical protein
VVATLISGGVVMAPEWTGCKGGWGARSCSTRDEDGGGRGKGRVGQSEVASQLGGMGRCPEPERTGGGARSHEIGEVGR